MHVLSITLIISLALDIAAPFLLAIPFKGYSHKKQVMSAIGGEANPLSLVYNLWLIVSGMMFILLGYRIFDFYHTGLSIAVWALVCIYGIGDEILSGIFPLKSGEKERSVRTKIHGAGSVTGLIAMQFAPLLLGILQLQNRQNLQGPVSLLCFGLSLICFCFFVMGDKPRFQNSVFASGGLWQRLIMYFQYIPFLLFLILSSV